MRSPASSKTVAIAICLMVILALIIDQHRGSNLVEASGKKKFLKGFILGALLGKSHYPVVYSMPSHGGHGGGSYAGYGGWK